MDFEKQLFEKNKVYAPDAFVEKTMKYIKIKEIEEKEKTTAKIEYSFFKLGQICVVAALLMIIINITPAEKIVYGQDSDSFPIHQESIMEQAVNKFNGFVEELKDFNIFNNDK